MTANDLIARLTELVAMHGDVEVVIDDGAECSEVFGVFGSPDSVVIDLTANEGDR